MHEHSAEIDRINRQTDLVVLICEINKILFLELSVWICDLALERLKKIYGWKNWFEYDYLQSCLVIVHFQTEALFHC